MSLVSQIPLSFFLLIFSSLLIFALGAIVYIHNRADHANKTFLVLNLSAVFLTLVVALRFLTSDPGFVLLTTRLSYASAAFVGFMICYFSYLFPRKNDYRFPAKTLASFTILVAALSYFTPLVIKDVLIHNSSQDNIFGEGFLIFAIFFPGVVGWGIVNLIKKIKTLDKIGAAQAKYILFGLLVAAA